MKYLIVLFVCIISSCQINKNQYPVAENGLDAGREFIDACLKGDFARAKFYMLPDDKNQEFLQKIETLYRTKDRDGRSQYRQASINISNVEELTENEIIIHYSNSFDKIVKKVKVFHQNNAWLVDFKYSFNPNL